MSTTLKATGFHSPVRADQDDSAVHKVASAPGERGGGQSNWQIQFLGR